MIVVTVIKWICLSFFYLFPSLLYRLIYYSYNFGVCCGRSFIEINIWWQKPRNSFISWNTSSNLFQVWQLKGLITYNCEYFQLIKWSPFIVQIADQTDNSFTFNRFNWKRFRSIIFLINFLEVQTNELISTINSKDNNMKDTIQAWLKVNQFINWAIKIFPKINFH